MSECAAGRCSRSRCHVVVRHSPRARRSPCRRAPRRAFRDRRLEIGRHAHRQRVDGEARVAARARSTRAARGTARAAASTSAVGSGDAHEAAQAQARQRRDTSRASATRLVGRDAALRRLAADVDLDAARRAAASRRRAAADSRCAIFSRSTLSTQSKTLAPRAPSCCSGAGRSGATRRPARSRKRRTLGGSLLDVVLAERALARPHAPRARPRPETSCETASSVTVVGVAPGRARRLGDARPHVLPRLLVVGHNR